MRRSEWELTTTQVVRQLSIGKKLILLNIKLIINFKQSSQQTFVTLIKKKQEMQSSFATARQRLSELGIDGDKERAGTGATGIARVT